MVSESQPSMHDVPIPAHISVLFVEQEVRYIFPLFYLSTKVQIVGDDTSALSSVLKADVWRDHLLAEEVRLNARLAELDTTPCDASNTENPLQNIT
jgi:ATP-binding cassette subfamily F protein 3